MSNERIIDPVSLNEMKMYDMYIIREYKISDMSRVYGIPNAKIFEAITNYVSHHLDVSRNYDRLIIKTGWILCTKGDFDNHVYKPGEQLEFVFLNKDKFVVKLDKYWDIEFTFSESKDNRERYICNILVIPSKNGLHKR